MVSNARTMSGVNKMLDLEVRGGHNVRISWSQYVVRNILVCKSNL